MRSSAWRASLIAITGLSIAAIVAGCTAPADPGASPSGSPSSTATPTPTPEPTLEPDGGAAENLPFFTAVLEQLTATASRPGGRAVVDALATAGFDKAAMQVTPDETAIGLPVDALLFSVKLGEECLLGQVDDEGLVTTTAPVLVSGGCLVGSTRSIDW